MAVLPIYLYDHAVLRRKAKIVKKTDEAVRQLAEDMLETMHRANGIGLAANQVGETRRVIVVDVSEMEESRATPPVAMINPEVLREDGRQLMEEGCLSIPELREEVERPEHIVVRYHDLDFTLREVEASGLFGRVILHEIDHLNGVLFIDHLSAVRRKLLRGKLNKVRRGELELGYPVVLASAVAAAAGGTAR
jgi:peptide deformylase